MKMNGIQASLLGLLVCVVALRTSSAQIVKPGVCPPERFFTSIYHTKTRDCENDNNCLGNKKCCKDNGYTICKPPAQERGGTCPENPNKTTKRCNDMCTSDSECAPGIKCCFKGCGKTCLPSVGEKKGSCGIRPSCLIAERPYCNGDSGCQGDEKCCQPVCTVKCMKPL
ncbi:WAP four-disulfide core domain protein 3-like [Bufo bufo]|uniref:WAP four-disulfide core domain protein 3-like n=1 Tax=Bufo bufo TaxID=8384 RepID=UPI001ABE7CDA|nr:WAP four-disulfide core domain protein 3-like [Bufo bufo]